MGAVRRYPDGTFCWVELGTDDVDAAKEVYAALLEWTYEEIPAGGEPYTIAKRDGVDVAAIDKHGRAEGYGWQSYIAVDDMDAVAATARQLGGEVYQHRGDLPYASRFAILRDPTGAEATLWQTDDHHGARLVNEIGTWCWTELVTPDLQAAAVFYDGLFGWQSAAVPGTDIERLSFRRGDRLIAGAHKPMGDEPADPRWEVSFRVADVDASVALIQALGGTVFLPPMDIPIGRFAIVGDPVGGKLTLSRFDRVVGGVDGSPGLMQGAESG